MKDIFDVVLARQVKRDLKKIPTYIVLKLQAWIDDVGHRGLMVVRKNKGYHDKPLHGDRVGQRSVRLNRAYRAIYKIENDKKIRFVEVIEVNKHEY